MSINLLKRVYDHLTKKTIEQIKLEKRLKDNEANNEYFHSSKNRSKYDHSVLCKKLHRNQLEYEQNLEKKLSKWNWLKRLC